MTRLVAWCLSVVDRYEKYLSRKALRAAKARLHDLAKLEDARLHAAALNRLQIRKRRLDR